MKPSRETTTRIHESHAIPNAGKADQSLDNKTWGAGQHGERKSTTVPHRLPERERLGRRARRGRDRRLPSPCRWEPPDRRRRPPPSRTWTGRLPAGSPSNRTAAPPSLSLSLRDSLSDCVRVSEWARRRFPRPRRRANKCAIFPPNRGSFGSRHLPRPLPFEAHRTAGLAGAPGPDPEDLGLHFFGPFTGSSIVVIAPDGGVCALDLIDERADSRSKGSYPQALPILWYRLHVGDIGVLATLGEPSRFGPGTSPEVTYPSPPK